MAQDEGFRDSAALLSGMLRISAAEARTRVQNAARGGPSEPLDVGRTRRNVPLGIRRTLIRNGGYAFPGCDRPPSTQ
ncbi:MAG: hypothetical protein ACRDTH_05935 [Pseudonocardiaceae bacterium]